MLTPLTIRRPGSLSFRAALISPLMRAVLAWPTGVLTDEAG
jgi:hypothetical protein